MIAGSILYLLLAGLDLGTSAEQILNGLYNSYVLLAVPLFLFSRRADEHQQDDRPSAALLRHAGRPLPRRARPHQHRRQSIIFAGMSGSAIADLAGTGRISIDMMTRNNRYPVSYAGAITARVGRHRSDHPAVDSDGALCADLGHLGRLPVPRRRHSGRADGAGAMVMNSIMAHRTDYPVEEPIPLREWPMITLRSRCRRC